MDDIGDLIIGWGACAELQNTWLADFLYPDLQHDFV